MGLACVVDGSIPSRGAGVIGGRDPCIARGGGALTPFLGRAFVAGRCLRIGYAAPPSVYF